MQRRSFSILRSAFCVLHSSLTYRPKPINFNCCCCAVQVVQARTRKNKNAERRTQNLEFRNVATFFLNSSFCILRSAFIVDLPAQAHQLQLLLLRGAGRTGENEEKQECRTQNAEFRIQKGSDVLSQFCVLRSAF